MSAKRATTKTASRSSKAARSPSGKSASKQAATKSAGASAKSKAKRPDKTRPAKAAAAKVKSTKAKSTKAKSTRSTASKTKTQKVAKPAAVKTKEKAVAKSASERKTKRRSFTPSQRSKFQHVLMEKHQELLAAYNNTKGDSRNRASDGTEDYIDYAVSSYDREFLLSMTELEQRQLRLVEEALRRVERKGEFGMCMQCGTEIPEKRLEVQPWARYCVACQELDEQGLLDDNYGADGEEEDGEDEFDDEDEFEEDLADDDDEEEEEDGD